MAKFKIKNESELEQAISLKLELAAKQQAIYSQERQAIALLKQQQQEAREIEVDGEKMTLAEREAEILEAARVYCKKHPEAASADGKKSRNYPAGIIGYRTSPAALERFDKTPWDKAILKAGKSAIEKLKSLLGMKVLAQKNVSNLVTIKIEPNITVIKNERTNGSLSDAQLKKLGLKYRPPRDELFISGVERQPDR